MEKDALNYALVLLPKANLDVLMVLLWFLEEVSFHAGKDQEWGNKMDMENLCTVIAPNILMPKPSEQGSEDPYLAISVIRHLMKSQQEMWKCPESIEKALIQLDEKDAHSAKSNEIIKKYRAEYLQPKNIIQSHTDY